MLSLIGVIGGLFSSAIPEILKMFTAGADRAHELAMGNQQLELVKLGGTQRLEEIQVQSDSAETVAMYKSVAPSGVAWVDALSATVRPIITYGFFALFVAVKWAAMANLLQVPGVVIADVLPLIWDQETAPLFAAVMGYWFGGRALQKSRGGR